MASKTAVRAMTETLSAAFSSFRKSDALLEILVDELERFDDETLKQATRRLIATRDRAPLVAHVVGACADIGQQRANLAASMAPPVYTEYSQRSKAERDGIDEARADFRRIWTALEAGTPVAELFPYDSEPCKLARHYAELNGGVSPDPPALGTVFAEPDEPTHEQERNKFRAQPDYDW